MRTSLSRILSLTLIVTALIPALEPMTAQAVSATGNVLVTQNIAASIAITAPTTITLTPLSVTQNSAVGTGVWTVTTNDTNGYSLTLNATTTPAMTNGVASFADYGTSTVTTWSVSNAYKFGFSVFGSATTGYGSGATCTASTDVPSTTLLWRGFYGTNTIQVASSSAPTSQSGVVTTLCVTDAQNVVLAPSGNYTATVVATATAL